jgi:hypothetical protein
LTPFNHLQHHRLYKIEIILPLIGLKYTENL